MGVVTGAVCPRSLRKRPPKSRVSTPWDTTPKPAPGKVTFWAPQGLQLGYCEFRIGTLCVFPHTPIQTVLWCTQPSGTLDRHIHPLPLTFQSDTWKEAVKENIQNKLGPCFPHFKPSKTLVLCMRSGRPVQMETAQLSEAKHCFSFVLRTCSTLIQYEAGTVISLSQLNHSICATQWPWNCCYPT